MRNARRLLLGSIALMAIVALVAPGQALGAVNVKQSVGDNEYKWQFYGFSQLEMRMGEGRRGGQSTDNDDLFFDAQRIRIGTRYIYKNVASKLFLDFNQSFTGGKVSQGGVGLIKAVKDAFVSYKFNHAAFVRLGVIKTPVGMNFTIPGWNLDIAERNPMEKALVPERDMGIMLSGRLIGGDPDDPQRAKINGTEMGHERQGYGFGYDIGIFNPALRSGAVRSTSGTFRTGVGDFDGTAGFVETGVSNGFALGDGSLLTTARLHYDHGTFFHGEVYWGNQIDAGGTDFEETMMLPVINDDGDFIDEDGLVVGSADLAAMREVTVRRDTEDYTIFGAGVNFFLLDEMLNIKGEYMMAENIRGEDGRDQDSLSVMVGYRFTPTVEGVIKHYMASAEREGLEDKDLTNTYVGFNFFLDPIKMSPRGLQSHKIVVNYVLPGGDDDPGEFGAVGISGYTEDQLMVQYQVKY